METAKRDSRCCASSVCSQDAAQPHVLVDIVVLAALVLYLAVFHALAAIPAGVTDGALYREVHGRFWMLPNLLACYLAGIGWSRGTRLLEAMACACSGSAGTMMSGTFGMSNDTATLIKGTAGNRIAKKVRVGLVAVAWAVLTVQAVPECDYHNTNPFRALGNEVLDQLPPGALLLSQGDLLTNTV